MYQLRYKIIEDGLSFLLFTPRRQPSSPPYFITKEIFTPLQFHATWLFDTLPDFIAHYFPEHLPRTGNTETMALYHFTFNTRMDRFPHFI